MAPALQIIGAIIAAALLPTLTSAVLNDTLYAVTVSSQLTGGSVETLCVQLHLPIELPCPICLKVRLEVPKRRKKTLILEEGITSALNHCFDFKVPDVTTRTVATISVVIEGNDESVTKKTKVLIVPPAFILIIRSDKPIYKPGQTVMFRIVSLNTDFLPVNREYKLVELVDANSNRIAQWLNLSNEGSIIDLSHPIDSEAATGTYTITAFSDKGEKITHTFKVEKFVLPKFEVIVHMPSVITFFDKELTFKICGKYTFGKPVDGSVKAVFCRKGYRYWWIPVPNGASSCKTFQLTTDKSGCASQTVKMTEFYTTTFMSIQYFEVTAEMMESGTGSTLTGSGKTTVKNNIRTVTFLGLPPNYKPGLKFGGKVKLTGPDDKPVANEEVFISDNFAQKTTVTTDSKGMAKFSFETKLWKDRATLTARPTQPKETFPNVHPSLRLRYNSAYHTALQFYSKSNSFVKLLQAEEDFSCDIDATVRAQYIINKEELLPGQDSIKFFYLVMSKGEFKQHGGIEVYVGNGVGKLSVMIGRVINLAPVAQVVIYTLLKSGEIVADSMDFPIQLCFRNKVSMRFPHSQQLPAQKTKLHLKAEPGSLCSVSAIDLSILLLEQQQDLTVDYVYSQLPLQKLSGYSYDIEDNDRNSCPFMPYPVPLPRPEPEPLPILLPEPIAVREPQPPEQIIPDAPPPPPEQIIPDAPPPPPEQIIPDAPPPPPAQIIPDAPPPPQAPNLPALQPMIRGRRSIIFPPFHGYERNDVYSVFKEIGIKIVTNMDVDKPCPKPPPSLDGQPVLFAQRAEEVQAALAPVELKAQGGQETVRSFFPETWIWDLVTVGDDGWTNVDKTVPDTITKWVAGAFCVSPVGFGVSPNTRLTVAKPFFVSLTLPYSVIRGESFRLRATVFNHLSKCIEVKVTLANSDQYTFKKCDGCQYTVCLCAGESKTFTWTVTPSVLGQVSLKVSAEALKNTGLCGRKATIVPAKGRIDTVIRTLPVEAEGTPQSVSQNALLCPAKKPVEEEFSLVLPKNFVEGSAKASVSVLGDLMGRALKNIDKLLSMPFGCGEQNMLKFAPNVYILKYLKSTGQLTAGIMARAIPFLEGGYQRELNYKHHDGSYSAFGQRDKSGNTWLTAFVVKSFVQAKPFIYVDEKVIDQAVAWLSKQQGQDGCIKSVGKLFHNAMKGGVRDEVTLTAYVAAAMLEQNVKASDPVVHKCLGCLRKALKGKIDNLYVTALLSYTFTLAKDEKMRLKLIQELDSKSTIVGGTRHWVRAGASKSRLDSLEVEMASYVLLALLSGPPLKDFDLGYSSTIVRWLIKQQNQYGGFSSTQDTVVALQALSKYGSITYSKEGTTIVTVSSKGGQTIKFSVDQSNRLLLQEESLSQVPGKYTAQARGVSCVLVQVSLTYNIPPPPDSSSFNISVNAFGTCNSTRPQVFLFVEVSYQGDREETNMVILDVKLLSGFTPDEKSLQQLLEDQLVKRVQPEDGHILIYLDEIRLEMPMIFEITIEGDVNLGVSNLKPAVAKVYDYYLISNEASTEYTSPCK